jgi:erythromycin esterase-like protein
MWRNEEVRAFVDWLRTHNAPLIPAERTAFHELDLYSLYASIRAVLEYLDKVDPAGAKVARERYGCLTPWQSKPALKAGRRRSREKRGDEHRPSLDRAGNAHFRVSRYAMTI